MDLQTDEAFLQVLVIYLKLGGEKLARQRIDVQKAEFETEFNLVKRKPIEEVVEKTGNTDGGDAESEGAKRDDDSASNDDPKPVDPEAKKPETKNPDAKNPDAVDG